MKRLERFGVALVAVFTLGVFAATSASAAEPTKILPEPTVANPLTSVDKSGAGTLLTIGGSEVKCTKDTSTASFTTPNLGTFHVLFDGCKAKVPIIGTAPCTGAVGDVKEQILLLGTVHYVLALLTEGTKTKLVAALAFLFEEFHFTCEALGQKQLILVKGCAAALAEPVEKLTKITKDVFKEIKSGDSNILEILMEEATKEIRCDTLTSVNGGAFELSAQTGAAENEKFEQGKKAVEVLLMNK